MNDGPVIIAADNVVLAANLLLDLVQQIHQMHGGPLISSSRAVQTNYQHAVEIYERAKSLQADHEKHACDPIDKTPRL